ncbi:MAG: hypothetical protein WDO74_07435 [Pseudomonadota bacterium]
MSFRNLSIFFAAVAALSACAGRVQILDGDEASGGGTLDCVQRLPEGGTTSRGGIGGSGFEFPDHAGSETAGHTGVDAGMGGEVATGGAPNENQGGTGAQAGGADGGWCTNSHGTFASDVLSHAFGGGQNFNQASGFPALLLGPPVADDPTAVVSLGNGGWVVLGFAGNAIVDGPGVDFTVFENPLPRFKELATVAVSDDAEHWTEFSCSAAQNASDFGWCAGVGVVHSSPSNGIDPLDPAVSGGDHYDLADIGVTRARFVRITDRVDLSGPAGVFDLDAVAIIHSAAACK